MSRIEFPTERLAAAYTTTTQSALPQMTDSIAAMIAQAFQQETRYVIDFDRGTPWDDSGEIIDTGMPFILENYLTVADFWKEYTGQREPTYESGRGWNFTTHGTTIERELATLLAPVYEQALAHLQQEEPTYYQQLVSYIQQNFNADAQTPADMYHEIGFNDIIPDTEIANEIFIGEYVQGILLATLLQHHQLPRHCQRAVLENITGLVAFMDELADFCTTQGLITSLNSDGPIQIPLERTGVGVTFGEYAGARELLMDHIARDGALILRTDAADATGHPMQDIRGWAIASDAMSVTPQRILPDDLYQAMNTDAQTGAKLPPEPDVRYL